MKCSWRKRWRERGRHLQSHRCQSGRTQPRESLDTKNGTKNELNTFKYFKIHLNNTLSYEIWNVQKHICLWEGLLRISFFFFDFVVILRNKYVSFIYFVRFVRSSKPPSKYLFLVLSEYSVVKRLFSQYTFTIPHFIYFRAQDYLHLQEVSSSLLDNQIRPGFTQAGLQTSVLHLMLTPALLCHKDTAQCTYWDEIPWESARQSLAMHLTA